MKNDDPFADLEARLRAWRPAELPGALQARLRAAGPMARRRLRLPRPLLAGAGALALGVALLLASHFGRSPDVDKGPAEFPGPRRTQALESSGQPRWVLGESLTMNIYTGVPPGSVPAALRLDGDSVAETGLIPIRSTDGKLPLKVDCQF